MKHIYRRLALILAALMLWPSVATFAVTPVQCKSSTTGSVTLTSSVTGGNTLVAGVGLWRVTPSAPTLTSVQTAGQTFALVDSSAISGILRGSGAYLLNATAGSTTVTVTAATTLQTLIVCEYAAADAVSFDLHGVATNSGAANPTSGTTGTTSFAGETLFGWMTSTSTTAATAGTSYGNIHTSTPGSNIGSATEDQGVTATGGYNAPFVLGGTPAWVAGVMTFKGVQPATRRRSTHTAVF